MSPAFKIASKMASLALVVTSTSWFVPLELRADGLCELRDTRQVLLTLTRNWGETQGKLRRFERSDAGGWIPAGEPVSVGIGRKGMAWGQDDPLRAPRKHEGDGKSPAGIFSLGDAFGKRPDPFAEALTNAGSGSDSDHPIYHQLHEKSVCVDAPAHPKYNQLLWDGWAPGDAVASHEDMLRADTLYDLGLVVEYNTPPAGVARGSCIFIHVRAAPDGTTAGCTAMDSARMRELLLWLKPSLKPRLVQLPWPQYLAKRRAWCLPEL